MLQPKIKYLGVHSVRRPVRNITQKVFFFTWRTDFRGKTYYYLQRANTNFSPIGQLTEVSEEIVRSLHYEEQIFVVPITSNGDVLNFFFKTKLDDFAREDENLRKKQDLFLNAAATEKILREDFQNQIKLLSSPEKYKKAMRHIREIPHDPRIVLPHKHLLQDCSITLRKRSLTELALEYAGRIIELDKNDDHAEFNLARLFTQLNKFKEAEEHMEKALTLEHSPEDESIYQRLLGHIRRNISRNRILFGTRR